MAPPQGYQMPVDATGNPIQPPPGYQYPGYAQPRPAFDLASLTKWLPAAAAGLAFLCFIWIFLPTQSAMGQSLGNYFSATFVGMTLLWVFVFTIAAAGASFALPKYRPTAAIITLLAGVVAMTAGWGVNTGWGVSLGAGAILMGVFGILLLAVGAYWTYVEVTAKD
jgi:hypothetical protein